MVILPKSVQWQKRINIWEIQQNKQQTSVQGMQSSMENRTWLDKKGRLILTSYYTAG